MKLIRKHKCITHCKLHKICAFLSYSFQFASTHSLFSHTNCQCQSEKHRRKQMHLWSTLSSLCDTNKQKRKEKEKHTMGKKDDKENVLHFSVFSLSSTIAFFFLAHLFLWRLGKVFQKWITGDFLSSSSHKKISCIFFLWRYLSNPENLSSL